MSIAHHFPVCRRTAQGAGALGFLLPAVLLSVVLTPGAAAEERQNPLIEQLVQVVLTHNPILKSRETLVVQSGKLDIPNPWFSLNAITFKAGTNTWKFSTGTPDINPWLEIGTNLSLFDPAKQLSGYSIRKERESARQEMLESRNKLVSELISRVGDIAKLQNKRSGLMELLEFLESQSRSLTELIIMGSIEPEKYWSLRERIMELEVEVRDIENQLRTLKLDTAMNLAGDAWPDLVALLDQVDGNL